MASSPPGPDKTVPELMVSAQTLSLPIGIYAFCVRHGAAMPDAAGFAIPAVQVGLAPVPAGGNVEFLTGPTTCERWLARNSDVVIARIAGESATLLLTSLRPANSDPLTIDVRRLDAMEPGPLPVGRPVSDTGVPTVRRVLRAEVLTHVQNRGDLVFFDGSWAGFVGQQLWIEAFSVTPLEELPADMIEYMAITAAGTETPWASDGALVGTRGRNSPLIGFAIRLKPHAADRYDCEYTGSFVSGNVVGPLEKGAICRSDTPDDPLEGILVRIAERRPVGSVIATGAGTL